VTPAVVFRPAAEHELLDAERWFENRHPDLGQRFRNAVQTTIDRILQFPLASAVHHDKRRIDMGRPFVSLVAACLLIGCHVPDPDPPPVFPANLSTAMRDLVLAERRWASERPGQYEFAIEIRCFWAGIPAAHPRFVVAGNTSSALGTPPSDIGRIYQSFDTVEELFQRIREVIKRGEHKVAIAYDPDLGYPQTADLDPLERAVDDELYFKVVDFKRR
jgi:hypothetical protein